MTTRSVFDEFYETFDIPKIQSFEPGRTVDNNGEICEHYINYIYPPIEPVFFDLLEYLTSAVYCNYEPKIRVQLNIFELITTLTQELLNAYKLSEHKEEMEQDIKEIFEGTYED